MIILNTMYKQNRWKSNATQIATMSEPTQNETQPKPARSTTTHHQYAPWWNQNVTIHAANTRVMFVILYYEPTAKEIS